MWIENIKYLLGLGPKDLAEIWPDRGQSSLRTQPLEIPEHFDYDLQIIIPVYNVEKYLGQALDSVIGQKTDFRYIITAVNDCSTDGSLQILRCYEQRYPSLVRVIDLPRNSGPSYARNVAIDMMLAPRLFIFDSDDLLAEGSLQVLYEASVRTGADFTEGSMCCFDDAGNRFKPYNHKDADHAASVQGFAAGKIIRLEVFREVQFPVGYIYEDTVFNMLLFRQFRHFATVSTLVYLYRINSNGHSLSTSNELRLVDSCWVTLRIYDDYLKSGGTVDEAYRQVLQQEVQGCYNIVKRLKRWDIMRMVKLKVKL